MELAKLEYADEVSAAKENATNELSKIRQETEKIILEAREKAKTEKNKTALDVVESKKTASEQILQVKEETAEAVAQVRENGVLEKQKIAFDIACLLYTSPSPRDATLSRMPSSA